MKILIAYLFMSAFLTLGGIILTDFSLTKNIAIGLLAGTVVFFQDWYIKKYVKRKNRVDRDSEIDSDKDLN